MRLPKATGITRDITIGITVRTMIGIPAPTTGRTIGSTGIGGTAGITANTMDLIGERTMTGIAGRIITIIDDNGAAAKLCATLDVSRRLRMNGSRLIFFPAFKPVIVAAPLALHRAMGCCQRPDCSI